jgi:IMP cyclohydrolase
MEDNKNGERKKLSLSLGGKLTLKTSVTSKASSSISTNTRSGRGTVQVEVKRTKRPSARMSVNDTTQIKKTIDNNTGLSSQEIQARSRMLQEGLAKTAAQAEEIAAEKYEKAKLEEARIAATADEASKAASSLAPKDKMLARRKAETEEILEIKKIEEEQKQLQIDARKAEEAALQAEKDRQKIADAETIPANTKLWTVNKVQEKEIYRENLKKPSWNKGFEEKETGKNDYSPCFRFRQC